MQKIFGSFTLVLIALVLSFCSTPDEVSGSESQSGSIFGRILVDSSEYSNQIDIKLYEVFPQADSTVLIDSLYGQQGEYLFESLPEGLYKLVALEAGQVFEEQTIELNSAEQIQVDIIVNITVNNYLTVNEIQEGGSIQNIYIIGAQIDQIDSTHFKISTTELVGDTLYLTLLIGGVEESLSIPLGQDANGNLEIQSESTDDLPFKVTIEEKAGEEGPTIVFKSFDSLYLSDSNEQILVDLFNSEGEMPEIYLPSHLLIPPSTPRSILNIQTYLGIYTHSVKYDGQRYYSGKLASFNSTTSTLTRFTDEILFSLNGDLEVHLELNLTQNQLSPDIISGSINNPGIYSVNLGHGGLSRILLKDEDWLIEQQDWVQVHASTLVSDDYEVQGVTVNDEIFNIFSDPLLNIAVDKGTECSTHKPALIGLWGPTQGIYCVSNDNILSHQYWNGDSSKHFFTVLTEAPKALKGSLVEANERIYGLTQAGIPFRFEGDVRDSLWVTEIASIPLENFSLHSTGNTQVEGFIAVSSESHKLVYFYFLGSWQSQMIDVQVRELKTPVGSNLYFLQHNNLIYFETQAGHLMSFELITSEQFEISTLN